MTSTSKTNPATTSTPETNEKKKGLGTFLGVYVPSVLMLFGVVIYMRLGWITGQGGLTTTLVIVSISALIALVTSLSLSAIASNIEVGTGGLYYIISRSLGIEVGCAVGLPLYFRQTLSIAFCVVGFSESLHDLIPAWPIQTIGIWTLAALATLAYVSLKGALKLQVVIFIAIIASFLSLFTGSHLREAAPSTLTLIPSKSLGFWGLFALFFPAMTGVESSVSLSGDLRTPSRSLPIGTITALLTAWLMYMVIPIFLVKHIPMDILASDPLAVQNLARIPALITVGIWGATLSSALGSMLGAPRTLQALANDGVAPKFFGRTSGIQNSPKVATVTTFIVALLGVYFGSINAIASVLTMVCLICYGLLNLSVGLEALMANPSWRPRFRIHWSISIVTAFVCLITMFMIGIGAALASIAIVLIIYLVAKRQQLHASWDDVRLGILMYFSRLAVYRLAYAKKISKSWRPHFLVFTQKVELAPNNLLRFSQAISQSKGFMTMAAFASFAQDSEEKKRRIGRLLSEHLNKHHVQAFVQLNPSESITPTVHNMIDHYGLGPLQPNTVVFGSIVDEMEAMEFTRIVEKAFAKHFNVILINDTVSGKLPHKKKRHLGDIHIWWDNSFQDNSEFMLVLGHMLQRNPAWKKARICLKILASNEIERREKLAYFQQLSIRKRLPWNTEIFVTEDTSYVPTEMIEKHSSSAGLIFLSLRPPGADESTEDYSVYIDNLTHASTAQMPVAYVLSSEHTPLEKILT